MDEPIKILCVDDEKNVLRTLERLFMDEDYEILTATSGEEGLEMLKNKVPIQIVISDYRMPGMNGVDFLKEVCDNWPETIRIVLSGYADTASVVAAINDGQVYKFIPKPWNDNDLKVSISHALERYYLRKKNLSLVEELKNKNEELNLLNENLEKLVAERTSELRFQNNVLVRSQNILDSLPVGLFGVDPDGLIVQCNRKGRELFKFDDGSVIGSDRRDTFSEDINRFIDNVINNRSSSVELSYSNHLIEAKGIMMKYDDGQEGVILVFDRGASSEDREDK